MKNQTATYMQDLFSLDTLGSPISGVRLDAAKLYQDIPTLLQRYINEKDIDAWHQITQQINTIYKHLDFALVPLDKETHCFKQIKSQIDSGKKLFFKLNLVLPFTAAPFTHGADAPLILSTKWPFLAATMRWFHDRLHIHYYQMAVGDAVTIPFLLDKQLIQNRSHPLTTEAWLEGKSDDFYGGWGFFFVRQYLNEHHLPLHTDCPMNGYEDSLSGNFLPPGQAGNRLMIYDLHKIQDTPSRGRTLFVSNSENSSKITLHKAIVGGNPNDAADQKTYPGCVLINLLPTESLLETQLEFLSVLKSQNIYTLHIIDALYIINLNHNDAHAVHEGYIWCALDPVALDLCCARYCFKTLSMYKAKMLKAVYNWPTEFVHELPIPKLQDRQIKSTTGYDSPLFRYPLFEIAEKKGLGLTKYHVLGFDTVTKCPLISINGHLGYLKNNAFNDLITQTLYYNATSFLHHLQPSCLNYAKCYDQIAHTSLYQELLDLFDENKDGIIDYIETDHGINKANCTLLAKLFNLPLVEENGDLKRDFLLNCFYAKFAYPKWNTASCDFTKAYYLTRLLYLAYELSCHTEETADAFMPHMHYGNGYWPSFLTVSHLQLFKSLYGGTSRSNLSLSSMYGSAFQYADKVLNGGQYTSASRQVFPSSNPLINYLTALDTGASYLDFTIYAPGGYGYLDGFPMPNVIETNDPSQLFTATFMDTSQNITTWNF